MIGGCNITTLTYYVLRVIRLFIWWGSKTLLHEQVSKSVDKCSQGDSGWTQTQRRVNAMAHTLGCNKRKSHKTYLGVKTEIACGGRYSQTYSEPGNE